jgi:hypothetical protein
VLKSKEIIPNVFIIENYISKATCDLLISSLSKDMHLTPRKNIFGGISGTDINHIQYGLDDQYNVAIDIYKTTLISIGNTVSNKLNINHKIKSYFFSCMKPGAKIGIHVDNNYLAAGDTEENQFLYDKNISALLYLNNNYEGGDIRFTEYNKSIKPSPGTLIFFEGDSSKPHEVEEVISGDRYNIVLFYEPVN